MRNFFAAPRNILLKAKDNYVFIVVAILLIPLTLYDFCEFKVLRFFGKSTSGNLFDEPVVLRDKQGKIIEDTGHYM